jgi:hypothetical protein
MLADEPQLKHVNRVLQDYLSALEIEVQYILNHEAAWHFVKLQPRD